MLGVVGIIQALGEAKARQDWLDTLPKEEADKMRADDARRAREKELHRRAIEVAEAGRPRMLKLSDA